MDALIEALKESIIFSDLSEDVIRQDILPHGRIQEHPRGSFLMAPQQRIDQIGVILSGRVHTIHYYPDGTGSLMSVIDRHGILGADMVCTRSRICPYHAVAAEATQVCYLPGDLFTREGMVDDRSRLRMLSNMLMLVSQINMKKEYRLAILSQKGIRERIVTYLVMQSHRRNCRRFQIPFSREELASFLCVNRSALSRELSLMQREGLISFRKNTFALLDDLLFSADPEVHGDA